MKFAAVASLAFVGAVAAQNSTTAATGCVAKDNACRASDPVTGLSANQAQCSAENAQCQGDCYAALIKCQTTPVDGLSANQAACVGEYATCLGENPISPTGGIISSFIPYTATASSSAAPSGNASMVYTTQVVTALTTVCPAPTAGAYVTTIASKEYTISSATTITVTDCPCTISSMVPAKSTPANGGMMTSATGKTNGTATTTKPVIYTGAAAHLGAGMGFLGAAAGAVMLL
ncbi:hypothetical protein KCU78_g1810, partial [Aureobasidium melanogenum]